MAGFWESLGASVKGYYENLTDAYSSIGAGVKGIYDVATSANDARDTKSVWGDFARAGGQAMSAAGQVGSAFDTLIDSNPVTRNLAEGAELAYHETVGRGLTSAYGVIGEADDEESAFDDFASVVAGPAARIDNWEKLFDREAWSKAYDASENISPGQMWVGTMRGMDLADIESARRRGDFADASGV